MSRNYLTIAIRHLLRHKGYSAINIVGLAIGMACCILILLYVHDELSYDRYHKKADRIYRVTYKSPEGTHFARIAPGWAPALLNDFPEIDSFVRLRQDSH